MISPDNELLFYTRKGKDTDKGIVSNVIEEFTLSQRPQPTGEFTAGDPLRAPFNTPAYVNYGGVSLSLDNKEMFYLCLSRSRLSASIRTVICM